LQECDLNDAEATGLTREQLAEQTGHPVKKIMNNMYYAQLLAYDNDMMIIPLRPVHKILAWALFNEMKESLRHWYYREKRYKELRIGAKQNSLQRLLDFGHNNNLLNGNNHNGIE